MKKLAVVALSAVFALSLGLRFAGAADAPSGPVKIQVEGAKRPPVSFEHSKHASVKCEQCHHTKSNEKGERKCTTCHKIADDKAPKIETVMHGKDKGVCFGCHRADNAVKKLACGGCHKS